MQARDLHSETITAAGAIAARRCVTYANAQAATQGEKVLGVARYDAAAGDDAAVTTHGTAVVETGAAVARGDSLIADAEGRAIPATGALGIAAGATAVASTAADGAILTGADLPEYVFADALRDADGAGRFVEVKLR